MSRRLPATIVSPSGPSLLPVEIMPDPVVSDTRSEKLRRQVEEAEALLKQQEQQSDRYNGRDNDQQVPRQLRQSRHRRPRQRLIP